MNCCAEKVAGTLDLRVLSMNLEIETKSKNNVFSPIKCTIQYGVTPANAVFDDDEPASSAPQKIKKEKGKR